MMVRFIVITFCLLLAGTAVAATSVAQLQQLINQKQYIDAANNGEQLLSQNPLQPEVRILTAYAYQMSSQSDRAAYLYQVGTSPVTESLKPNTGAR